MTDNGISVAETNAIVQDHTGFIWIGGSNGLARYDGHDFDIFRHVPKDISSLSNNFIWDLLVDNQGNLWVATTKGLNRFIPETETFERYLNRADDPETLISNDVYTLLQDREGYIWVGTRAGLDRFDPKTKTFHHFRHRPEDPLSLSDDRITALYQDRRGNLWVGTRRGLNRFNPRTQTFDLFRHDGRTDFYPPHSHIGGMVEDVSHNLWVGTDEGLYRFNQTSGDVARYQHDPANPSSLSDNRISSLLLDSKQHLWITTDHGGLNQYVPETDSFFHYRHNPHDVSSLASDQVREIFEDNAGDYWIALFPTGVDYANHTANVFTVYSHQPEEPNSLMHDAVLSIASGPEGKVWIGTEGGLNLLDPTTGKFQHYRNQPGVADSLGANAVLAIAQDTQGRYWFGTWSGGLNLWDPKRNTFQRFMPDSPRETNVSSQYVWSLLGDSKGRLWVGTEAGSLDVYDPKTDQFTHFVPDLNDPTALSGGFMRAIIEDHQGVIWVATLQGLNRFDDATQTFRRYQHQQNKPSSIPHDSVAALFEDSRQRLWVGTESGLALLTDADKGLFKTYSTEHGLPNDSIMGIAEDAQGFLWINTLNGLSRFNPQTEVFTNYNRLNGLAGNIMNRPAIHFSKEGELYVGSTKGITRFRPENVRDNPLVPPLVFTGFRVFNEEVAIGEDSLLKRHIQYTDRIILDYTQSMFSIHFAALSYRNSAANQYAYRLQGFDDQWINAGGTTNATYTNLNPGHYVFTVKGANNNRVWNEEGRSIHLTVLPPPWRTWWAYSIYTFLSLVAIYAFVHSQRRKVEFEKQKVAHLRAIDKLKDEFLANTSHELRTPLNGIIGLTESLIDDPSAQISPKVRHYLKMVAGSGRRLSNLINDILDFSKIKNHGIELRLLPTNFANVCDAVCIMLQSLADKKSIRLINDIPENMPPVLADEDRLQQILYNLIGNAIKFTVEGEVRIYAKWDEGWVTVYVQDTGVGIPEAEIPFIFESFTQSRGDAAREFEGTGLGLAVAQNLIELHGGKIHVESEEKKGSTFQFTLKVSTQPIEHQQREVDSAVRLNAVVDNYNHDVNAEWVVTESPNVDFSKFHILVVDDDPINRQVLIGQLALHHYRISQASNGLDAIEKIKTDPSVNLVLLDVMMPRMTGYEVAQKMRAIRPVHELPIIFITAKHLASDLVTGFIAGGNDFLIKPVSKNELLSRTKTHLLLMDVTRNLERIVEERTNTLREAQRSLEIVDNIVNLINQQSDLEGLAHILLKESAKLLDHKGAAGAFWLLNEKGNAYNLISVYGEDYPKFPTSIPSKLIVPSEGRSLLQYGVQIMTPDEIEPVARVKGKIDSALVMGIKTENQLAALLVFVHPINAGQFSERDVELFSRLETHAISAVSKARMLEALKRQNQKLEEISYTDSLTQLHNRRHLIRYLQGDLALCKRRYQMAELQKKYPADADLLFLLVDIDHFKPVNDTYGHNAGDAILKQFASIMKSVFRESDHLIRWGGEEFLVVVRFFDRKSASGLVERFRREVEQSQFDIGSGKTLRITCSVGFSCYPFYQETPESYSWEQVVEMADRCLYIAKKTQRNAWVGVFGNSGEGIAVPFEEASQNLADNAKLGNVLLISSFEEEAELVWE